MAWNKDKPISYKKGHSPEEAAKALDASKAAKLEHQERDRKLRTAAKGYLKEGVAAAQDKLKFSAAARARQLGAFDQSQRAAQESMRGAASRGLSAAGTRGHRQVAGITMDAALRSGQDMASQIAKAAVDRSNLESSLDMQHAQARADLSRTGFEATEAEKGMGSMWANSMKVVEQVKADIPRWKAEAEESGLDPELYIAGKLQTAAQDPNLLPEHEPLVYGAAGQKIS